MSRAARILRDADAQRGVEVGIARRRGRRRGGSSPTAGWRRGRFVVIAAADQHRAGEAGTADRRTAQHAAAADS